MAFEKPNTEINAISSELVRRLNENSRRLRIMEQKIDKLESSMDLLEDNTLNQMNDMKIGLERIATKITALGDKLTSIETDMARINKELGRTATKAEVKQLETFIDLVNPITAKFVTKGELERAFEDKLGRKA
ncbi:MAG: hypothetical protein J4452_00120 [Candidatus Aenigmarchaeota archaeon]|nr:hypothetical protein [Candidatus Aenigmarchaeota archaeon]